MDKEKGCVLEYSKEEGKTSQNLSKERKKLIHKLGKLRDKLGSIYDEIDVVKSQLKVDCPHEKEYVEDYSWEHDDGYGRQSNVVGQRCILCSAVKPWLSSSLWHVF